MSARLPFLAILFLSLVATAADQPATQQAKLPFRTDTSNAQLPWYQLKSGEFPPRGSEHRVIGELVEADFIHRSGQFRTSSTGELVDFKLLPCATVAYLNAGADLRDIPLGTSLYFSLYQDEHGAFTRVAAIQDDFSELAASAVVFRVDELHLADGKLNVTKQKAGAPPEAEHAELRVNDQTRIWKTDHPIKLNELIVGDSLLVNFTDSSRNHTFLCSDIWAGAEAQKLATTQQRKRHTEFLKARGLPAIITRVEGKKLSVTLFGEPDDLQAILKSENINPAQWAKERRRIHAVVANQDLRSYNPPVDGQGSTVVEYLNVPTDSFGSSGISWVIEPNLLLEGFRVGHVIRLFAHPSWKIQDMPFGEGVYTEVPNAKVEEESINQYPFRTDFGNENLPWYQLKPGEFPPYQSHHLIAGELLKADANHRSGQFRADRTGEIIDFTMPPFAQALYHKADADFADLPLGAHYFFFLYQDDHGAFTRAAQIMDDFTNTVTDRVTYRLEAANLAQGILLLARQLAPMKDERDHLVKSPDLGHGEFSVDDTTRIWKGDTPVKLTDLTPGDDLLVNLTGRTATSRGHCTEIFVGPDTHKKASDDQRKKHGALLKEQGLPAWIDRVEGKEVTITFFAGMRADFPALLEGDPWGKSVQTILVDEERHPQSATPLKMSFKTHLLEGLTAGTYGCSGVRWVLESQQTPRLYKQGQIIRLWKEGWPIKIREAKSAIDN